MSRGFLLVSFALIAACNNESDKLMQKLLSAKLEETVVSITAAQISEKPATFSAPAPLKVVGGMIAVCYVLRDSVVLEGHSEVMAKILGGAKIKTVVQLGNGERHEFAPPMPAWNADGKLGGKNEVAACSSYRTCTPIPIGSEIVKIEVSATAAIDIKGIYYMSGTILDPREFLPEKELQKSTTTARAYEPSRCKAGA